jgi:hypothetical protein
MTPRTNRSRTARWGAITLGLVGALVLSSCATSEPSAGAAVTAAVDAQPVAFDPDGIPGVIASEESVLDAELLVLTLEQLLGDHVLQVAGAAVVHAEGADTETALALLADNTAALTGAIGLVYGDIGADAFASLWSQHIAFLLDHAHGRARADDGMMTEAEEHLGHYEAGFGSFASTATEGALPADVVADLLAVHVADINGHVADVLDGDVEQAARGLIAGHDYAADIGAAIGAAIAAQGPQAFPTRHDGEREAKARELARALAAHVVVHASPGLADADDRRAGAASASSIVVEVDARVTAALAAVAGDADEALVQWRALTTAAAERPGEDRTARLLDAASALAHELGVPDAAPELVGTVDGPRATRVGDDLTAAQAAAYALATAWLTT